MPKIPDVKPDWNYGIYIGNGVVAKPPEPEDKPVEGCEECEFYGVKCVECKLYGEEG
jgi:hypothetical protein